jgi:DNA-binding transcriptional ArsR family regulator
MGPKGPGGDEAVGHNDAGCDEMSGVDRDLVFGALADGHRRLLLERLRTENGQTLTALGDGLPMSRQAVTKHLQVLEAANLVVTRRQGREKLHYLNPVPIHAIAMRWLRQFDALKLDALLAMGERAGTDK